MVEKSAGRIVLLLVGLVFLLVGGGIGFFVGKPILDRAKASESWPSTEGEVIESKLESSRRDGKTSYSALVVYRYRVDGEDFECDRVWFGQYSTNRRSEMQKIVKEYPVGKTVAVYFSPDDSANAVLQPGAFTSSYMVFGIGMLFLGIGCLLVIVPILKILLVIVTVAATGSSDSRRGEESWPADSEFSSDTFDADSIDDDGFEGIPGR